MYDAKLQTISLIRLGKMFPNEASAEQWFEDVHWPDGRHCGKCGSVNTYETKNRKPAPYRCRDCRSYFSVRTGTAMDQTNLPLRKWAYAVYLFVTSLKGISSTKLAHDIEVTQKTAWFVLHRLRTAWEDLDIDKFTGPVEVDETYVGGKVKNMHGDQKRAARRKMHYGKSIVVGAKDRKTNKVRAQKISNVEAETLQGFVKEQAEPKATVFTDEHRSYDGLPFKHKRVNHSAKLYVDGEVHTNGIESFWAVIKRAHKGTFHKLSDKHLQRYVDEFCGKHNTKDLSPLGRMQVVAAGMIGKRLMYRDLISNG